MFPMSEATAREWLADAPGGPPPEAKPLPCLNSNISNETENPNGESGLENFGLKLSSSLKKAGFALEQNIKAFCETYGIERVGFLTLTFAENVEDPKEAQRRFNSLATRVLRHEFAAYVTVLEAQDRGAVHYHLLVACPEDIRTGFDFAAFLDAMEVAKTDGRGPKYWQATKQYAASASPALRSLWHRFNGTAAENKAWKSSGGDPAHAPGIMPRYGFGRSELLPVRTTSDGIAAYVGKYMQAATISRPPEWKGARLIRYSQTFRRVAYPQMGWVSPKSRMWREKLATFAESAGIADLDGMKETFGPRWAYELKDCIAAEPHPEDKRPGEAPPVDWERTMAEFVTAKTECRDGPRPSASPFSKPIPAKYLFPRPRRPGEDTETSPQMQEKPRRGNFTLWTKKNDTYEKRTESVIN